MAKLYLTKVCPERHLNNHKDKSSKWVTQKQSLRKGEGEDMSCAKCTSIKTDNPTSDCESDGDT